MKYTTPLCLLCEAPIREGDDVPGNGEPVHSLCKIEREIRTRQVKKGRKFRHETYPEWLCPRPTPFRVVGRVNMGAWEE